MSDITTTTTLAQLHAAFTEGLVWQEPADTSVRIRTGWSESGQAVQYAESKKRIGPGNWIGGATLPRRWMLAVLADRSVRLEGLLVGKALADWLDVDTGTVETTTRGLADAIDRGRRSDKSGSTRAARRGLDDLSRKGYLHMISDTAGNRRRQYLATFPSESVTALVANLGESGPVNEYDHLAKVVAAYQPAGVNSINRLADWLQTVGLTDKKEAALRRNLTPRLTRQGGGWALST
jgi:hypothetical protein